MVGAAPEFMPKGDFEQIANCSRTADDATRPEIGEELGPLTIADGTCVHVRAGALASAGW